MSTRRGRWRDSTPRVGSPRSPPLAYSTASAVPDATADAATPTSGNDQPFAMITALGAKPASTRSAASAAVCKRSSPASRVIFTPTESRRRSSSTLPAIARTPPTTTTRCGCHRATDCAASLPSESVDSANTTASPSPAATNDAAVPTSDNDDASATTSTPPSRSTAAPAAVPVDHALGTTASTGDISMNARKIGEN